MSYVRDPARSTTASGPQACALVGLILRLWWNGPYRIYPCFFSYLLLTLLQTAILPFVPYSSLTYGNWWRLSEGLIVCAYVLVILRGLFLDQGRSYLSAQRVTRLVS